MSVEIVPFTEEMLPDAGTLLAKRHEKQRVIRPELPVRFEDPLVARNAVASLWNREDAAGVAAVQEHRLLAYMIGDRVLDELWGRSGWVRYAGCACDPEQDIEIVRDLYAVLAAQWVAFGCFHHFAMMPSTDAELVSKWHLLGFGIEKIHAIVALDEIDLLPRPLPAGITIRRSRPEDRALMEELSDIIWRHQTQSPDFGIHLPEVEESQRKDWGDLVDDAKATVWLAFLEGRPAGVHVYYSGESGVDDLLIPEQCLTFTVAGTRGWARGRGITSALLRQGLAEAYVEGKRYFANDWRSANLLASRVWPKLGFHETAYRLVRRINPSIAWAGQRER